VLNQQFHNFRHDAIRTAVGRRADAFVKQTHSIAMDHPLAGKAMIFYEAFNSDCDYTIALAYQ
jgi:hypothetical protein